MSQQVQIDLSSPQQMLNMLLGRQQHIEAIVAAIRTRPATEPPLTTGDLSDMLLEVMQTQSLLLIAMASMQQHRLNLSSGGIAIPQFGIPRNGGR